MVSYLEVYVHTQDEYLTQVIFFIVNVIENESRIFYKDLRWWLVIFSLIAFVVIILNDTV
jgi:hypothetical protein